jgi:hypothetical protein
MPITIAHPAAVIPMRKWGLPISALVVGSISPDLEYLTHISPTGGIGHFYSGLFDGHSITGLFLFCLPVGLVALLVMHKIWKPAAASLLSSDSYISRELNRKSFRFLPIGRLAAVCLGILVGAFSHLLWDSFTHSYGWMVQHVPVLTTSINLGNGISLSLFRLLQHISTIFGISVLATLAVIYRGRFGTVSPKAWTIVFLIVATGALGGIGLALAWTGLPDDLKSVQHFLVNSIAASFALAITEITLLSLAWRVRRKSSGWSE